MQVHDELDTGEYYQFDSYTLDREKRILKDGDRLIELTPKVFTTLLVLLENRDKVLTKEELLSIIWPGQFVDQSNLSQNISVLRKSLGESESGKKYIATFPGRGYRFVGNVELKSRGNGDTTTPQVTAELDNATEIETVSAPRGLDSRPDQFKSVLRNWNSASIVVLAATILVAMAAFVMFRNAAHSKLRDAAETGAPPKVYARMNAGLTQPAWSRDGRALAFVAMDLSSNRSAVYIQSKGDIQAHSVLSDSGQYSSPSWSPDGTLLAFLHFEPGTAQIIIFDIQRKSSRVLTTIFAHRYGLNYRHLDWSPDGKFLVVDDKTQDAEPFSLYMIYLASGQRVRLTYPDSDMIGDISPRVSPDGTRVAFIRDIDFFEQDVYIASVQGRIYKRITPAHTLISDVGWTTNNTLAFAADYGEGFRFWRVDPAKQGEKQIMTSPINSDRALQFSASQNGKIVAFSNYSPDLDIWSLDITKPSRGWIPVIQAAGENIQPVVSPNGKFLAFLSNVSGRFQLWVSQVDGTNASPVPTGTLVPVSFCWSSDGQSLIFSPQRIHGLYEVSVHGEGQLRQISSIYTDPHSSVDGRSLFARAHFFIYRVPLQGGNPQEMTEQGGAPIAQSQDGRYLYFSQGRMNTTIARLDMQTGHEEEVLSSLLPGYSDAWALSSQGIVFLGQENSDLAIRFFNFSTRAERHIANFPGNLPQVEMSGFGIAPDGKHLWVVRADPMPSDIETTTL